VSAVLERGLACVRPSGSRTVRGGVGCVGARVERGALARAIATLADGDAAGGVFAGGGAAFD